jgi:cytochrome c oxidase subunit IV
MDRALHDHLLDLGKVQTMDSTQSSSTRKPLFSYTLIFFVLAAITLVELLLSNRPITLTRSLLNTLFIAFSLGKAALIAAFFMHLRSDNRFYTLILLIPVVLLLVFAIMVIIR